VSNNRSAYSVVQAAINIKNWIERTPSVEETRPSRCPVCRAASHPVGDRIQLHGHGTRGRDVLHPGGPGEAATLVLIAARRYRCVPCRAVILVVPREVRGRRVYSASAIGFALALWGLVLATAAQVRRRVCPAKILGPTAAAGWITLRRWARAVARGHLFSQAPASDPTAPLRRVAASTAAALAAHADPTTRTLAIEHRALLGAAHAA
jgi:hypothetical protein